MTKEELRKEFEKYLKDSSDYYDPREPLTERKLLQMWLDCAEPREKYIAELTEQNTSLLTSVENLNKSVQELEAQIEKMKCCENCKYNSYWGDELHCNYGLKEALQEDKLVECKNMDKWEIKEK